MKSGKELAEIFLTLMVKFGPESWAQIVGICPADYAYA